MDGAASAPAPAGRWTGAQAAERLAIWRLEGSWSPDRA
jgi:hypothetical protein